jgi:hypothetical protein
VVGNKEAKSNNANATELFSFVPTKLGHGINIGEGGPVSWR